MARSTARRTRRSLKGGRVWLTRRLGDVSDPTRVMTIWGTAALSWSAIGLVVSPGPATSSRPAWSAAVRVPALGDDHGPEPVEIGSALHEVVRILHVLHELAAAPFLELERTRAHAAIALVGQRHMGRIDGGLTRGQHHEDGRLGSLETEDHGVGLRRFDGLDVGIPVL